MKITLKTTAHNTTPQEQYEKFLGEWVELQEAIENLIRIKNHTPLPAQYTLTGEGDTSYDSDDIIEAEFDVVDEAFDCCKSLQKWLDTGKVYEIIKTDKASSEYFDDFERNLQHFQDGKKPQDAINTINSLLHYGYKFCTENGLDFEECLRNNDEKNERRNYHTEGIK